MPIDSDGDDEMDEPDEASRFFTYFKANNTFGRTGKRPSNQSTKKVRAKVAARIERDIPAADRLASTSFFLAGQKKAVPLSQMAEGRGLDMAHGVSASEIAGTISGYMSARKRAKTPKAQAALDKAVEDYAAGMITTDADSEDEVRELTHRLSSGRTKEQMAAADKLLNRVNRSSGNLIGGDSSSNRGIGKLRDIPKSKRGPFIHVKRRADLQDKTSKYFGIVPFGSKVDAKGRPITSTQDY